MRFVSKKKKKTEKKWHVLSFKFTMGFTTDLGQPAFLTTGKQIQKRKGVQGAV